MAKSRTMWDLTGKLALVTGAGRGLGRAMALALAEHGADLALVARTEKELKRTAAAARKLGAEVCYAPFDLAEAEDVPELMDDIKKEAGLIDILVNNAGTTRRASATEMDLDDWDAVMAVNVRGMFALSREVAKRLIAKGRGGKIINVASLMSKVTRPGTAAYATSKGAVAQLTKALAVEWAEHAINVNAIAPGYFKTEMTEPLYRDRTFDKWVKGKVPLGRWGEPEDMAGLAVFLASHASDFITGQIIYIDGGWLAHI
jgi:NAD(P)-dependent dehydrogenase (short-subunit alcohol dehydrogenase family)